MPSRLPAVFLVATLRSPHKLGPFDILFRGHWTRTRTTSDPCKDEGMPKRTLLFLPLIALVLLGDVALGAEPAAPATEGLPWWCWCLILFAFTFVVGLIAPVSGVGGGVLFVPLATAFFPFSIDFIRGTGLVMALVSAQSSAPSLIRRGLSNIRVMVPVVVVSMVTSVVGGIFGLYLTANYPGGRHYIVLALGGLLFFIFVVMLLSKRVEHPEVESQDRISKLLDLCGEWQDGKDGTRNTYRMTNLPLGVCCFALVGFVAGMFGLGAGWANVPALNLIMGAPIKIATSTSMAIITVNDAAAAWTYLSKGAVLPLIAVPCVLGVSIGARIGAHIAARAKPTAVKYLVMAIMLLAAGTNIYKGLKGLEWL